MRPRNRPIRARPESGWRGESNSDFGSLSGRVFQLCADPNGPSETGVGLEQWRYFQPTPRFITEPDFERDGTRQERSASTIMPSRRKVLNPAPLGFEEIVPTGGVPGGAESPASSVSGSAAQCRCLNGSRTSLFTATAPEESRDGCRWTVRGDECARSGLH